MAAGGEMRSSHVICVDSADYVDKAQNKYWRGLWLHARADGEVHREKKGWSAEVGQGK